MALLDKIHQEVSLLEVLVADGVEITRTSGSKSFCKSFFKEEKTPSCIINTQGPLANTYKCFSTNNFGNLITYYKEVKRIDDIREIIRDLAARFPNTKIDKLLSKSKSEIRQWEKEKTLKTQWRFVVDFFHELAKDKDLILRLTSLSEEQINQEKIGIAPSNYKFPSHLDKVLLQEMGLITDKGHNVFFNRIIIPIYTGKGEAIGISGKATEKNAKPKYLNSKKTIVWEKSHALYGEHHMLEQQSNCVALVEGQLDALALYKQGFYALATLGSFGKSQIDKVVQIIKSHNIESLVLFPDNDDAGNLWRQSIEAYLLQEKAISPLVYVGIGDNTKDVRQYIDQGNSIVLKNNTKESIHYLVKTINEGTGEKKTQALALLNKYLTRLSEVNATKLIIELDKIQANIKSKTIKDFLGNSLKKQKTQEEKVETPEVVWSRAKRCTYVGKTKVANFIAEPMYHTDLSDGGAIKTINFLGQERDVVLHFTSEEMSKLSLFNKRIQSEKGLGFSGKPNQFSAWVMFISTQFEYAIAVESYGLYSVSDWVFSNGIFFGATKQFVERDDNGFVHTPEVVYHIILEKQDLHTPGSMYYPNKGISISEYALDMESLFGDYAYLAIAFIVLTFVRDIITKHFGFFPHFFLFAKTQSGKTSLSKAMLHFFFTVPERYSINNITLSAYSRIVSKNACCPMLIEEYQEHTNQREIAKLSQAIKDSFDNGGRHIAMKNHTKDTKTFLSTSSTIIAGQYPPTKDDGGLSNRCFLRRITNKKFSEQEKKKLEAFLKKLRDRGVAGISELLPDRENIANHIIKTQSDWAKVIEEEHKESLSTRGASIVALFIAAYDYVYKEIQPPQCMAYVESPLSLINQAFINPMKEQLEMTSTTDILADFLEAIIEMHESSFANNFVIKISDAKVYINKTLIFSKYAEYRRKQSFSEVPKKNLLLSYLKESPIVIKEDAVRKMGECNYEKSCRVMILNKEKIDEILNITS